MNQPPPPPPGEPPKPPPRPPAPPTGPPPLSNGGSQPMDVDSPTTTTEPKHHQPPPTETSAASSTTGFGWNAAAKPAPPPAPAPPQQQQQPSVPSMNNQQQWGRPAAPPLSTEPQQQPQKKIVVSADGSVRETTVQPPTGTFHQAAGLAAPPPTTFGVTPQPPVSGVFNNHVQPPFGASTAAPVATFSAPPEPIIDEPPQPAASMVESPAGPSATTMASSTAETAAPAHPGTGAQVQNHLQQQQPQQIFNGAPTEPSFNTAGSAPAAAPSPAVLPLASGPPVASSGYPATTQPFVPADGATAALTTTTFATTAAAPPENTSAGGPNHSAPPPASTLDTQQSGGKNGPPAPSGSVEMETQQTNPPASKVSHTEWAQSVPTDTPEPVSGGPDNKPAFATSTAPTASQPNQPPVPPEEMQSRPAEAAAPSYDDGSTQSAPQTQQSSAEPPQPMQTERLSYDHRTGSNESGGYHQTGVQSQPMPQAQRDAHPQPTMSMSEQQQVRGPPQQSPHGPPQHHAHHGSPPGHPPPQQHPQQHAPQPDPHGAALFGNGMGQALPQHGQQPPSPGGMRELRVEDALLYLDDVKREFKDRPAIYNEFLAIMKNFKSQEVDTPGVIARVSKLFRGYNNLILGFNTFLPDGYKISLADLERAEAQRLAEEQAERESQAQQGIRPKAPPGKRASPKTGPNNKFQQQRPMQGKATSPQSGQGPMQQQQQVQWSQGQSPHGMPLPNQEGISPQQKQLGQARRAPFGPNQGMQQQQQQSGPPQHQAVEFDHAISYVTTIKRRFSNDPSTYHSFLEILHTYQKEQRGIKEVLEQVAHLFQDHPDLLKEFTFFLPDAVQEQAKERMHRAAAESESRLHAQRMEQYHQRMGKSGAQQGGQHFIDMTRSQMGLADDSRGRKRFADGQLTAQPEAYEYNSAVERQFFDSAREALTSYARDGGQAWAEFLKCLDMYAQEILSRGEMLNFVEPLLGKRNNSLFEEFKRMLIAAGSPTHSTQLMEDSWYSVPLSEIDFSRCRRCSPSYRALPRDYPDHPCSDRSEEEAAVLNDIWVSLPVGSEESYTFRHMRRNTYEETLFRVEDERFEIDMVIDSNAATLQRLEPVAEEIALLAQEDVVPTDLGIKLQVEGAGLGGKRFQYTFDKNLLGVIHRNSIARIYGDAGQEMLDLLVKNPTVAVPLVLQRLRQKDTEWRKVRDRLNRQWKELSEHNYYKSLDHRSLTWRTTDKRAISTRTLISEIKDRALNEGRESEEAKRQKLDKAKEEHGSFYEVTVGEKLTKTLDLTFLPKPDRRLFTPHLSLMYKNVSWAQRDAYRILAYALERGPISPGDKERCHRLWVEFLGPWFELSLNWMQKPAVCYQESTTVKPGAIRAAEASVVSEEDEDSMEEEPEPMGNVVTEHLPETDSTDKEFTDHHPLPAGAHVSTLYGEGKILEFRRDDHIYAVQLAFGATGYLRPATVLCSMLPVEKSAYTRQLRADDRSKLARPNDQLAFGTQNLYLFFRLHHILVNRLNTAKRLAYSVGDDKSLQSMVEQMPNVNPKAVGRRRYEAYLSLVYALLDGGVGGAAEGGKYEDRVRSLLGHGAFELATMDKLISHIWKDIQTMANDETMWNMVQLYRRHSLAGSFQPEAMRQEAAYLSDGEPMYAFQQCPLSSLDESVLHMEYLGIMDDEDEDPIEEEEEVIEAVEQPNKRPKR